MNRLLEIYQKYESRIDELGGDGFMALSFGPSHIVWEDHNFEDHNIQFCIDDARKTWESRRKELTVDSLRDLTGQKLELVVESLKELLAMPEAERLILGEQL